MTLNAVGNALKSHVGATVYLLLLKIIENAGAHHILSFIYINKLPSATMWHTLLKPWQQQLKIALTRDAFWCISP